MNYIIIIISSLVFFLIINNSNPSDKTTKVIIKIPQLTDSDINYYLKNEFNNISDIDFVDGSSISKTIVLNVNPRDFNKKQVENMLSRWGLESDSYAFESMVSSSEIE